MGLRNLVMFITICALIFPGDSIVNGISGPRRNKLVEKGLAGQYLGKGNYKGKE